MPDSDVAIMGLAEKGQYTGVEITSVTDTEVYFTAPDGTFGVRTIEEIQRISLRDNASFNKAEELLAADRFTDAAAAYKSASVREGDDQLKALVEARLGLAEQYAHDGRPKPVTQPATRPMFVGPSTMTLDLGNKVTMKLVRISAGKFMMGSPANEKDPFDYNEGPQHQVTISKPFHIGVYEVTQEQWTAVMGTTPWRNQTAAKDGASNAANYISWNAAAEFCSKLSQKTGKRVTLPTEAQWEYACRAGTQTRFYYGDDNDYSKLGEYAWYDKNAENTGEGYPHAVGLKKPNAWGLYDMHGNVWEWCDDWYGDADYTKKAQMDSSGASASTGRVLRGGSFSSQHGAGRCKSTSRGAIDPAVDWVYGGLRVVVVDSSQPVVTVPAKPVLPRVRVSDDMW